MQILEELNEVEDNFFRDLLFLQQSLHRDIQGAYYRH